METNDVCPTDILIEFKDESEVLPVHKNREDTKFLNNVESEIHLNDKKDYDKNCPTGVLIDVPFATNSYLNEKYIYDSTKGLCKGEKIKEFLMSELDKDLKEKAKAHSDPDLDNYSKVGDSHNSSPNGRERKNEVFTLHWTPPSPQSMCHISKEASKVIQSLNSAIFEEDSLLAEEILSNPLDFDDFDLDGDEKVSDEEVFADINNNFGISSSVIIQNTINTGITNEINGNIPQNSTFSKIKSQKMQNTLSQPVHGKVIVKINLRNLKEGYNKSRELCSSESQSESLNNSNFSASDASDDVFIVKSCVTPEDKENITELKNEIIVPKERKSNNKTTPIGLSKIKPKLDPHSTNRNSNIYKDAFKKNCSFSKNINTSLKKVGLPEKSKEIQPLVEKLPRSSSVNYQRAVSRFARSNTFQFQSTKELMTSMQKQSSAVKDDSERKSLSSDLRKQISNVKTPSRRYSICTFPKDVSSLKLPVTPAIPRSYQKTSVPRYLPESVRAPRLSFSRSWQQPASDSPTSVKGLMQRNPTCKIVPPSTPNVTSGMMYSKNKQSFSHSMSAISFPPGKNARSTSSKVRFGTKLGLPSPLPSKQDRKLARELFPSVSGQMRSKTSNEF